MSETQPLPSKYYTDEEHTVETTEWFSYGKEPSSDTPALRKKIEPIDHQELMTEIFADTETTVDYAQGQEYLSNRASWGKEVLRHADTAENGYIMTALKVLWFAVRGVFQGNSWTADAKLLQRPTSDISEAVKYFKALAANEKGSQVQQAFTFAKAIDCKDPKTLKAYKHSPNQNNFIKEFSKHQKALTKWVTALENLGKDANFDVHQSLVAAAIDNVSLKLEIPLHASYLVQETSNIWINGKSGTNNANTIYKKYAQKMAEKFVAYEENETPVDMKKRLKNFDNDITAQVNNFDYAIHSNNPDQISSKSVEIYQVIWDALLQNKTYTDKIEGARKDLTEKITQLRKGEFEEARTTVNKVLTKHMDTFAGKINGNPPDLSIGREIYYLDSPPSALFSLLQVSGEEDKLNKKVVFKALGFNTWEDVRNLFNGKADDCVQNEELDLEKLFIKYTTDQGRNHVSSGKNNTVEKQNKFIYEQWKNYAKILPHFQNAVAYLRQGEEGQNFSKDMNVASLYDKTDKEEQVKKLVKMWDLLVDLKKLGSSDEFKVEAMVDQADEIKDDLLDKPFNLEDEHYRAMFLKLIGRSTNFIGSPTLAYEFIKAFGFKKLAKILTRKEEGENFDAVKEALENLTKPKTVGEDKASISLPGVTEPIIMQVWNEEELEKLKSALNRVEGTNLSEKEDLLLNGPQPTNQSEENFFGLFNPKENFFQGFNSEESNPKIKMPSLELKEDPNLVDPHFKSYTSKDEILIEEEEE